jgi:threonine/homoserine/homoserine lactone efflux protein
MTFEAFAAMLVFAVVMSATPGPNNMLLLASGVNYGFRPTLPHMAGITLGFAVMLLAVGLGIGAVLAAWPRLQHGLRIASILYMLWFAWRLATAGPVGDNAAPARDRPMSFLEGAAFQWVNPKAWAIALSGTATYTSSASPVGSLMIMVAIFTLLTPPMLGAWTAFGVGLRRLLADPWKLRAFNVTMALGLVASLWPVVTEPR